MRWGLAAAPARIGRVEFARLALETTSLASEEAINTLLTSTFPKVGRARCAHPDAKELDLLRQRSGALGEQDLEALLAATATAWPADRGPVDSFAYEPGRLILSAQGWSPEQIEALRSQLRSEAWTLDASDGRRSSATSVDREQSLPWCLPMARASAAFAQRRDEAWLSGHAWLIASAACSASPPWRSGCC